MPTRFEHRATFSVPVTTVYGVLVDRTFLDERLRLLGGKGAAVVEHTTSGEEVLLRLRQGLDAQRLPGAARAIVNGDLVVDREERWRPDGAGYAAAGRVSISGVPGEISSRTRLLGAPQDHTAHVVTAEVRVGIPLIGGRLEDMIAQQVGKLLAAEAEFAGTWLTERGA